MPARIVVGSLSLSGFPKWHFRSRGTPWYNKHQKMKRNVPFLILLTLLAFSSVAQANTGTPLMWATTLHLLVGNLFIGIAEGWLLAKLFKLNRGKTIGLLIAANYVSAWVGNLLLARVDSVFSLDITNAWTIFWFLVVIAYLSTRRPPDLPLRPEYPTNCPGHPRPRPGGGYGRRRRTSAGKRIGRHKDKNESTINMAGEPGRPEPPVLRDSITRLSGK